ncbi:MAG: NAD(P)-dependent oxidoreductase [candidate division WOR-3 bacterium]
MKILITGANGLIGRNLIKILSRNNKIYAVVRDKSRIIDLEMNENIVIIELDLSNISQTDIRALPSDVDTIYYLAQSRRFREFPEGSEDVFNVNVEAPLRLINWATYHGVRKFIYASSGGVYTNPTSPIKEFFMINANEKLGFYLSSKLSSEMLLRNYSSFFETFAILRPFFVYGPGQNNTMLIPRLINNIMRGEEIILSGEEGIKIDPIYVSDSAEAFAKVLDLKGEYLINIAGAEIISIKQLSLLIAEMVGREPKFRYESGKQMDLVADISLMKQLLHTPKVSLREGIREVLKSWG